MFDVVQQNVLYTLGQLATEFPEVSELLAVRLQEADLRMPARPPPKTISVQQNSQNQRRGTSNQGRRGGGSSGEPGIGLDGTSMDSGPNSAVLAPRTVNLAW
jgi:hypothetical protein